MKPKKRRLKPKMLLLSEKSDKSITRLAQALAWTALEDKDQYKLRARAGEMLEALRKGA